MNQSTGQDLSSLVAAVAEVVCDVLEISDETIEMTPETQLLDGLPGLDSMAVVEIMARLEDRFDVTIDGDDFSPENFESLGTLARMVGDRCR